MNRWRRGRARRHTGQLEMDNEHYILTGPFKVDDKSGNYVNIFNVL